ncbi:putative glutathione S-transferase [Capsicum annuum]|nr:putative glutathione S-transferase [Capsicum annuum]
MTEVKLLGVGSSSYSRRVEWALKVKGVKYEFIEEDLQNKSPFLLESNPVLKKIPVLIHNGKPIRKSMIILEYIDEAFEGPSILPKYPYESAIARFWAKFLDGKELDSEVHSRRLTEKQRPTLGIDHSNKILHCTVKFDGFEIDKAEDLMKMVQIPCYELLMVLARVYAWLLECHNFEDSVPDELTRDEELLTNFEDGNDQLEYRINKLEASLKIIGIHILQQASDLL